MDPTYASAYHRLVTEDYQLLQWTVWRNLKPRFYQEADDVLQDALLLAWGKHENLQNPLAARTFILSIVAFTAQTYHRYDHVRRMSVPVEDWREFRASNIPSAEQEIIARDTESERRLEFDRLRSQLSPRLRQQLDEWKARGYRNHTHAQELKATRIRKAISLIVGHPVSGIHLIDPKDSDSAEAKKLLDRRAYWRKQKQKRPPDTPRAA